MEQLLWKVVFYRPIEEFRRRIKAAKGDMLDKVGWAGGEGECVLGGRVVFWGEAVVCGVCVLRAAFWAGRAPCFCPGACPL